MKEELAPFFAMCAHIIELHSHKHTLRSLMKQEELIGTEDKAGLLGVATRIEAEQGAVLHVQRQLDALLWRK